MLPHAKVGDGRLRELIAMTTPGGITAKMGFCFVFFGKSCDRQKIDDELWGFRYVVPLSRVAPLVRGVALLQV